MKSIHPEWARVRRAEKMFLGSTSPSAPLTEVESEAIIRCRITKECARDFRLLLERKGVWQGGPCFGVRANGELRLQAARPGGPRPLLSASDDPFALHPGYVLGLSDMLDPIQYDWRAHWIAAPDSLPPEDLLRWADEGLKRGLVDDEYPLIGVGRDRDGLSYWAVIWRVEDSTWQDLPIVRP